MGFNLFVQSSPYPWLFFSALFMGAALARMTRRLDRKSHSAERARTRKWVFASHDAERARTRKWVFTSLYLSLCLGFALGAVFIPGPEKIEDIRHLYFFLVCSLLFFLIFRFKKSLGLPVFLLSIAVLVAVLFFLRGLTAFTGETEIARLRVLAVRTDRSGPGQMKVEVIPALGRPVIIELDGTYLAPVVRVIIFEDYLVFMGAKTWYRFDGLSSFSLRQQDAQRVFRQENTDFYFPHPPGISERLWAFYEQYEEQIPGVRTVQVELISKKARELASYSIRVQNDGGVQVLEGS